MSKDKGLEGDTAQSSGPGSTLNSSPEDGLRGNASIPIAPPRWSRSWFGRLFHRDVLVPLNFKQPGCPELKVGDRLLGVLENDSYDLIAASCRMDPLTKAGYSVKWKVKEIMDHGSILIESGDNRTFLDHMRWDDGNRVTVPSSLAYTRKQIRFYKLEGRSASAIIAAARNERVRRTGPAKSAAV